MQEKKKDASCSKYRILQQDRISCGQRDPQKQGLGISVAKKIQGRRCIEGLKDRPKSGIYSKISRQVEYGIQVILKESNQGWSTKQVEEMIIQENGIKYNHNYIYYIPRRWALNRKYQGKYM